MPDGSVPLPNIMANGGASTFPIGLLIAIIVLILMSGFFSSTETAFSCVNKIKLRTLAGNGNKKAKKVLDLAENNFDKLISTILIGNNIVNLSASTLSTLLFAKLIVDASTSALVSTVAITIAVLIFGEITPKFIAKVYPEKLAMAYYPLIKFFYYVFYVFNFILLCIQGDLGSVGHRRVCNMQVYRVIRYRSDCIYRAVKAYFERIFSLMLTE